MRMMLLTKIEVTNDHRSVPTKVTVTEQGMIAMHPWAVTTIEPYVDAVGKVIGSMVYLEYRGFVSVKETMTDIMHLQESIDMEDRAAD